MRTIVLQYAFGMDSMTHHSYGDFAEWWICALYWWSYTWKGLRLQSAQQAFFFGKICSMLILWSALGLSNVSLAAHCKWATIFLKQKIKLDAEILIWMQSRFDFSASLRDTCHVSRVRCHMSGVACQVSHITFFILFSFFWQIGGDSWWTV